MSLKPPPGREDHSQGRDDAPVTLVEYGDYQCPYCGEAYAIVKAVQREMGSDLRFVFRNFPLQQAHPQALAAASMAEAAAGEGLFWPMHDLLYEHQDQLDDAGLAGYGRVLGLSDAAVEAAFSGAYLQRIRQDFDSGIRSGVNGTPAFFINGRRHDGGWDAATLLQAMRAAAR